MRVLVTGGAGFIGVEIVRALLAGGHEPVVLDALLPATHDIADGPRRPLPDGVRLLTGDVRDPAAVTAALAGVDAVCHQAAMVGLGVELADLPGYVGCNDLGTAVLLAAMARAGVGRLVLAGSMVVYGEGRYTCAEHGVRPPGAAPAEDLRPAGSSRACPRCGAAAGAGLVAEEAPPDPRNVYAATKLAQEHLRRPGPARRAAAVTRCATTTSTAPACRGTRRTPGVAAIFRSALDAGRAPRVFEDGGQRRDFVHVRDVAAANVLALEARPLAPHACGTPPRRHYNVASGTQRRCATSPPRSPRPSTGRRPW